MVNTASVAAVLPIFGTGPYSASKHAVLAISDVLRAELADTEVGVSTVMPGLVRTGMIPAGEDPAVVANAVIAGIRHDRPYVIHRPLHGRRGRAALAGAGHRPRLRPGLIPGDGQLVDAVNGVRAFELELLGRYRQSQVRHPAR